MNTITTNTPKLTPDFIPKNLDNETNEEIKVLDDLKTKTEAVADIKFQENIKPNYVKDSTAIIKLTKMETTKFTYNSFANTTQFAVFSEMFFDDWVAYIDGIKAPIARVNYVLRGLEIPQGKHEIIFEFQPTIVKKGNVITIISYISVLLISLGWFLTKRKIRKRE